MQSRRSRRPDAPGVDRPAVTRPRPGHADLAGVVKYGHDDIRNVLERASARETAARVAVGAIARQLLAPSAPRSSATSSSIGVGVARAIRSRSPSRTCRRSPTTRRCTASIADVEQRDDRRDRSRARGRRHDGRQLRGDRARRAGRASAATSSGIASSTAAWRRR